MPIFLEKFILPILVTLVMGVCVFNPWKWDWHQRVSLLAAAIALAYFVGYTLTKNKPTISPLVETVPASSQPQVNQQAGDCSANANGNNNSQSINCDENDKK